MQTDLYSDYKPLRNLMRTMPFLESMMAIWHYYAHVEYAAELPLSYTAGAPARPPVDLRGKVFKWELEVLAREIVLNAPSYGKGTLTSVRMLGRAVGALRRLDNAAYRTYPAERS